MFKLRFAVVLRSPTKDGSENADRHTLDPFMPALKQQIIAAMTDLNALVGIILAVVKIAAAGLGILFLGHVLAYSIRVLLYGTNENTVPANPRAKLQPKTRGEFWYLSTTR